MIRVTLQTVRARWPRTALTSVAVVLGVAMVTGTLLVGDTAEAAGSRDDDLELLGRIMLIAGAVALLVGAFIVNITTSVTVAQRTRELALLRCLGAERKQIRRAVLLESLVVGVLGWLAGFALGIGVGYLLRALVNTDGIPGHLAPETLEVAPRTVVVSLLVGCVVTVLSALAPAVRAGRVSPMAAVRDPSAAPARLRAWRVGSGAVVLAAGLGTAAYAVAGANGYLLLPAGAATLIGLRLLGPAVAGALAGIVGRPLARRLTGELGRQNARRNPERTAATVSALMIGLALLSLIAILGTSTKAYVSAQAEQFRVDFELWKPVPPTPDGLLPAGATLPPGLVADLRATRELDTVLPMAGGNATVGGRPGIVSAADAGELSGLARYDMVDGSMADLGPGTIGVTDRVATRRGWTVGSSVPVKLSGETRTLTVRAIYVDNPYAASPDYLLAPADYAALGGDPSPLTVYATAADGVPLRDARAAVDAAVTDEVEVEARTEQADRDLAMIDRAIRIYLVLAGLAAVVGLVGVVNVLALSVVERRRELGLLRAVGMERRQVRSMVRAEAVIVAAVGAVLGLGLGTYFGWAATEVLARSSSPTLFTVPVGTLAAVAALAVVAGMLAAVLPARWASRVDVLRAVAAE